MGHVTFIHGIANKPPQEQLLDLWNRSLANGDGIDLGAQGITCSMVYWADVLYDNPLAEAVAERATNEAAAEEVSAEPVDLGFDEMDAAERLWVLALAAKLAVPLAVESAGEAVAAAVSPGREVLERIPLPWAVKERIMKKLLRDVHHYLFNVESSPRAGVTYRVQDEIRRRMTAALADGAARPGPHVVVSHSMGTVIAYDCLKRIDGVPAVDGLMTIGSPLGVDEVQDKLKPGWSRGDGFPGAKLRGKWVNVYDRLDPVAGLDPKLANDYRQGGRDVVDDLNEQNHGAWRHDVSKYLSGQQLRGKLRQLLGLEGGAP
jgi:predicted alpha/beta hydrolase family esterase